MTKPKDQLLSRSEILQLVEKEDISHHLLLYQQELDKLSKLALQKQSQQIKLLHITTDSHKKLIKDRLECSKELMRESDGWDELQERCRTIEQLHSVDSVICRTLELLDSIENLKKACVAIHSFLDRNMLADACTLYSNLDSDQFDSIQQVYTATSVLDTFEDSLLGYSPVISIKQLHGRMKDMLVAQFDAAVKEKRENDLIGFFKLFPHLSLRSVGLASFSKYVCSLVANHAQQGIKIAVENGTNNYVELLSKLYEMVAAMIEGQHELVETHYGPGSMSTIIDRLKYQVETQAAVLIGMFNESKQIDRKLAQGKAMQDLAFSKGQQTPQLSLEPRELDQIVLEMAAISQKASMFELFLKPRLDTAAKSECFEELQAKTKFQEIIQMLTVNFVALADAYVLCGIRKSIELDIVDPDTLISTCVDDTFFILKNTIYKGCATSDVNTICALVNSVSRTLDVEFLAYQQKNVISSFPNHISDVSFIVKRRLI